jgi:hypothetical protein
MVVPANPKPLAFKSLAMASDWGLRVGIWDSDRQLLATGRWSTKDQM